MAIQDTIWAGTERSLQAAVEADATKAAHIAAGQYPDKDDGEKPRLLEVQDGVAVISIRGALNNSADSDWNSWLGLTGYPEIRDALIAAAHDESAQQILLDVDSGGGAVSGVEDTSKLIRMINDKVKPVTTYSEGVMASAAMWLGAAAGRVYIAKTAVAGSVSVIATHMERSKQLADAGVGVTVIRSGKFKALANGVEKLSAEGAAQLQQVVDASAEVFIEAMASMRGKSVEYTREHIGQGQEFVGQKAVDVGLADGLSTFDALMSDLRNKAQTSFNRGGRNGLVGQSDTSISGGADMAIKKALTEQDIAALAAGAAGEIKSEVPSQDDTAPPAANAAAGAEKPEAEAELTPQVSAEVDKLKAGNELLVSQLAAKDEALIQAHVKMAKLEADLKDFEAVADLKDIAAKAVNNMRIACRASTLDFSAMSYKQVLAEYSAIAPTFAKQYPVGGVAAVGASDHKKNEPAVVDAQTQARLAAVHFSK